MNPRNKLEEIKISENCKVNIFISMDETSYILQINYLDGKFISEKSFANNFNGIASMEEVKNFYKSENDVKRYFGII